MFPKKHKLSSNDFKLVYDKGRKFKGEFGQIITLSLPAITEYKVGFVVNKKIGGAVERHLTTRRLRSLFRKQIELFPTPLYYQYISFKYPDNFKLLEDDISDQFKRIKEHYS